MRDYRSMSDQELGDLEYSCVRESNEIGSIGVFEGGARRAKKAQLERILSEINYERTRRKQYGR